MSCGVGKSVYNDFTLYGSVIYWYFLDFNKVIYGNLKRRVTRARVSDHVLTRSRDFKHWRHSSLSFHFITKFGKENSCLIQKIAQPNPGNARGVSDALISTRTLDRRRLCAFTPLRKLAGRVTRIYTFLCGKKPV